MALAYHRNTAQSKGRPCLLAVLTEPVAAEQNSNLTSIFTGSPLKMAELILGQLKSFFFFKTEVKRSGGHVRIKIRLSALRKN